MYNTVGGWSEVILLRKGVDGKSLGHAERGQKRFWGIFSL